jgi:hypothetical protein
MTGKIYALVAVVSRLQRVGGRNLYLCAQVKAETHAVVDAGILLLSELLSTSQGYSLSKVALKKSR